MARRLRLSTYPLSGGESHPPDTVDELDYATANDVVPVRVPLEKVELGAWKYTATELEDIELCYELESSDLLVKTNICGSNGAAPAKFRIREITAADLALVNVVPGSLESMVVRLMLETQCKIWYENDAVLESPSSPGGEGDDVGSTEASESTGDELSCHFVVMNASVHEAGHLRDILLFLKGGYTDGDRSPDNLFLRPLKRWKKEKEEDTDLAVNSNEQTSSSDAKAGQVTFIEGLPFWAPYVPWWFYSRQVRKVIQMFLFLYYVFSVMWASWQLYRHVDIIHHALEPIMAALRVYLSSIMEMVDVILAAFTVWWMTYLSPLNVFLTMFRSHILLIIRGFLTPLLTLFTPLWRFLSTSAFLSSGKALLWAVYYLFAHVGHLFVRLLSLCAQPLVYLYNILPNYRIASIDAQVIRVKWAFSLIANSLKAIGNGFANLIGYTRKVQKQKRALKHGTPMKMTPSASNSPKHVYRSPRMPVYYSSPLTKQD